MVNTIQYLWLSPVWPPSPTLNSPAVSDIPTSLFPKKLKTHQFHCFFLLLSLHSPGHVRLIYPVLTKLRRFISYSFRYHSRWFTLISFMPNIYFIWHLFLNNFICLWIIYSTFSALEITSVPRCYSYSPHLVIVSYFRCCHLIYFFGAKR